MGNPFAYYRIGSARDLKHSPRHAVRDLDWDRDLEMIRSFYARFSDRPVDPGEFGPEVGNPVAVVIGGSIASFAIPLSFHAGETEIGGAATVPEMRSKGYCKDLISVLALRILDEGKAATLTTEKTNLPMRKAAEAIGMRLLPEERQPEGAAADDAADREEDEKCP